MIDTYGELLLEFMRAEQRRLDEYALTHGPTIGDMYEGLSRKVVSATLPLGTELSVVSGFITDGMDGLSRQIDCMLVSGEGEAIPLTQSFKWHVRDVIAVLAVKKTVHSKDIEDAIPVLQSVKDCQSRYIDSIQHGGGVVDLESAEYAFAQATKLVAPGYDRLKDLPFALQMVFHTLVMEQLSPTFIVLGYSGFASEYAFRNGIVGILERAVESGGARLGVPSFPQLIISGAYSAVKANGQPYVAPVEDGVWQFLLSCAENPALLLLEVIWTRLQLLFGGTAPWGEDLETQVMHGFLGANAVQAGDRVGWEYFFTEGSNEELAASPVRTAWSPSIVTAEEATILDKIFNDGAVSLQDARFIKFLTEKGLSSEDIVSSLLSTDLVAIDGQELVSIARKPVTAVLPDGRIVIGDDNTGRLTRWVQGRINEDHDGWESAT